MKTLIDELEKNRALNRREWETLFTEWTAEDAEYLFEKSRRVSQSRFGNKIYIRGLIEISSYCKNNCYYCGIRRDNRSAERYRLTEEEILACCETGYGLGFRTFVLQGGEDSWYTPGRLVSLVSAIRQRYPDCAITLSLGEMEKEVYQSLFDAGANRYLPVSYTHLDVYKRQPQPFKSAPTLTTHPTFLSGREERNSSRSPSKASLS